MTHNPIKNAVLAAAYIVMLVLVVFNAQNLVGSVPMILAPMAMLSLFVISAAVMGYLFVFPAATLYLDGKKKEAVALFLKTVGVFALIVFAVFVILVVTK